jgi:hypothetical protein
MRHLPGSSIKYDVVNSNNGSWRSAAAAVTESGSLALYLAVYVYTESLALIAWSKLMVAVDLMIGSATSETPANRRPGRLD